jgi:hypothetical protein
MSETLSHEELVSGAQVAAGRKSPLAIAEGKVADSKLATKNTGAIGTPPSHPSTFSRCLRPPLTQSRKFLSLHNLPVVVSAPPLLQGKTKFSLSSRWTGTALTTLVRDG